MYCIFFCLSTFFKMYQISLFICSLQKSITNSIYYLFNANFMNFPYPFRIKSSGNYPLLYCFPHRFFSIDMIFPFLTFILSLKFIGPPISFALIQFDFQYRDVIFFRYCVICYPKLISHVSMVFMAIMGYWIFNIVKNALSLFFTCVV